MKKLFIVASMCLSAIFTCNARGSMGHSSFHASPSRSVSHASTPHASPSVAKANPASSVKSAVTPKASPASAPKVNPVSKVNPASRVSLPKVNPASRVVTKVTPPQNLYHSSNYGHGYDYGNHYNSPYRYGYGTQSSFFSPGNMMLMYFIMSSNNHNNNSGYNGNYQSSGSWGNNDNKLYPERSIKDQERARERLNHPDHTIRNVVFGSLLLLAVVGMWYWYKRNA